MWGGLVRSWLDELLPEDAHERCQDRVSILVKQPTVEGYPWLKQLTVNDFESRQDLIDCCMASVHVPLFLDTKLTTQFRGKPCVDGSIEMFGLAKVRYELPERYTTLPTLKIAPFKDPRMRKAYAREGSDFLRLPSGEPEAAVREMMAWGTEYIDVLDQQGELELLRRL